MKTTVKLLITILSVALLIACGFAVQYKEKATHNYNSGVIRGALYVWNQIDRDDREYLKLSLPSQAFNDVSFAHPNFDDREVALEIRRCYPSPLTGFGEWHYAYTETRHTWTNKDGGKLIEDFGGPSNILLPRKQRLNIK